LQNMEVIESEIKDVDRFVMVKYITDQDIEKIVLQVLLMN